MKITDVRAAGLRGATPQGGWAHEINPGDSVHTLVAVHTDTGEIGLGSVFAGHHLVEGALQEIWPLLDGESGIEPERVSEKLHQATFWMGRGGTVTQVIGGIDIALWDLLGKVTGQPVGRLLGGRYRETVRPYASLLMKKPDILAAELEELVTAGWRAFKIGWGPFGRVDSVMDREIVAAAREAVGPQAVLAVDAGGSDSFFPGNYKWAMKTAEMLAEYDVAWFEEALPPDALEDFVELRRNAAVPIAGCEVLTRRQSFQPWIERRAVDIIQPDVTKVGGLSEQRRIGLAAEDHGIRLIPHGWNTAVGLAADLHLASALPQTNLVEYLVGSPYVDELARHSWELNADGELTIPSSPGLGLDLDADALVAYAGSTKLVDR